MNQPRFNLKFGFNYRILDHHWIRIAIDNHYNISEIIQKIDTESKNIQGIYEYIEQLNDTIKNIQRLNLDERIERLENGLDIYK